MRVVVLFGLSSAISTMVFFSPIASSQVRMLSLGGSHFLIGLPSFLSRSHGVWIATGALTE